MKAPDLAGYRVVAVHAHPDDESITMGGTLYDLSQRGAEVTVVTCTLGEQGEVIGEAYQELVADKADLLGGFRIAELNQALQLLGVRGVHLGEPGAFRDSGMAGDPANTNPRAFIHRGEDAVRALTDLLGELRPHVLLTYGPDGGYGHPDHIQAHRITMKASRQVHTPRVLWSVRTRADLTAGLESITVVPEGWTIPSVDELDSVETVDLHVRLTPQAWWHKKEAMKAHATQLWIADGSMSHTNPHSAYAATDNPQLVPAVYALSNLLAQPLLTVESFLLGAGVPLPEKATGVLDGLER